MAPQTRKGNKWRGEGTSSLKSLEVLSAEWEELAILGGSTVTMAVCFVVWTSVIRSSNQGSEHRFPSIWMTGSFSSTLASKSWGQAALGKNMHNCLLHSWGWGIGSCDYAKSWNWLKLLQFIVQVFPGNVQAFNRLHISKIAKSDRFCQCSRWLGGRSIPGASYFSIFPEFSPSFLQFETSH